MRFTPVLSVEFTPVYIPHITCERFFVASSQIDSCLSCSAAATQAADFVAHGLTLAGSSLLAFSLPIVVGLVRAEPARTRPNTRSSFFATLTLKTSTNTAWQRPNCPIVTYKRGKRTGRCQDRDVNFIFSWWKPHFTRLLRPSECKSSCRHVMYILSDGLSRSKCVSSRFCVYCACAP